MTDSRTWTLVVAAPDEWLTANGNEPRHVRARLVRAWRAASFLTATRAKLPRGLARVRIEPVAHFRDGRRPPVRDTPNLAPTVKAAVDGLGRPDRGRSPGGKTWSAPGYLLVPDDSDKHVELEAIRLGDPLPASPYAMPGQLVLVITELQEDADVQG